MPDQTRQARLEAYDHTHDPNGHPLTLVATQDVLDTCPECGRTAPQGYNHERTCSSYQPHPASIAAQEVSA